MRRTFSIVELVVVCVVIGILASVAIAHYSSVTRRAYRTKAAALAQEAGDILHLYYQVYGGNYGNPISGNCPPPCTQNLSIEGQNYQFSGSKYRGDAAAGEYFYIGYPGNSNVVSVFRSSNGNRVLDYNYKDSTLSDTGNPP